jgi:antirestriction protein ArdC
MTQLQQQLQSLAHWRGSEKTADAVRQEIARRWGEEEAKQHDPLTNCFTIQTWNKLGYRVKKGEKAIRSITYVEATDQAETTNENEDEEDEQNVRTYPKTVYLFYRTQVEKR